MNFIKTFTHEQLVIIAAVSLLLSLAVALNGYISKRALIKRVKHVESALEYHGITIGTQVEQIRQLDRQMKHMAETMQYVLVAIDSQRMWQERKDQEMSLIRLKDRTASLPKPAELTKPKFVYDMTNERQVGTKAS